MAFTNNPKIMYNHGEVPLIVYGHKEANSQTFTIGELVYEAGGAAAGQITVISTSSMILGIAQVAGTNTSTTNVEIPVEVIKPGMLVNMKVINNATACTTSSFVKGLAYDSIITANVAMVDLNAHGNTTWIYEAPILDALGAETNRGIFRLAVAKSDWLTGK